MKSLRTYSRILFRLPSRIHVKHADQICNPHLSTLSNMSHNGTIQVTEPQHMAELCESLRSLLDSHGDYPCPVSADILRVLRDAVGSQSTSVPDSVAQQLHSHCDRCLAAAASSDDLPSAYATCAPAGWQRAAQLCHNVLVSAPTSVRHLLPLLRRAHWPHRLISDARRPKLAEYVAAVMVACARIVLCGVRLDGICYDAPTFDACTAECLQYLSEKNANLQPRVYEWHRKFILFVVEKIGIQREQYSEIDAKLALVDAILSAFDADAYSRYPQEQGCSDVSLLPLPHLRLLAELAETRQVAEYVALRPDKLRDVAKLLLCLIGIEKVHNGRTSVNENGTAAVCAVHNSTFESDIDMFYDVMKEAILLIGNLAFNSRQAQTSLGQLDCVPALLDCTAPCRHWPLRPQFAIASLSHLCRLCAPNQAILFSITGAEPKGCIDASGLLQQMGMQAELDHVTGKMKLTALDQ